MRSRASGNRSPRESARSAIVRRVWLRSTRRRLERIIDLSRTMNRSEGQRVADQQQTLEDAIGANTPVDVSPVAQTMMSLANAPTTGPANTRALNPRIADLNELIQRQNPVAPDGTMPYPPTAAYGGVKDLRSDLGARSNSADPLQGYYLDRSRNALTDVLRNTAVQAGQGPQFDQANLDYTDVQANRTSRGSNARVAVSIRGAAPAIRLRSATVRPR